MTGTCHGRSHDDLSWHKLYVEGLRLDSQQTELALRLATSHTGCLWSRHHWVERNFLLKNNILERVGEGMERV